MVDARASTATVPMLQVRNLSVHFGALDKPTVAVENLDLDIAQGEVLGLVGESGSGKSVSMMAIMGLVDTNGRVSADHLSIAGTDLQAMSLRQRHRFIGEHVGMIFQDPMASLDPCYRVGEQLTETLALQGRMSRTQLRDRALELLRLVEIPDPVARMDAYPHHLSGGMCQRIMIAMALSRNPSLLIADEPTTALDVTIQAQIMAVLRRLQRERNLTLLLISHDLALVSSVADRVVVMYAGQAVESGRPPGIFRSPQHPYTRALMQALPESSRGRERLLALPGVVPGVDDRPSGCLLAPRCPHVQGHCGAQRPLARDIGEGRQVACHFDIAEAAIAPDA